MALRALILGAGFVAIAGQQAHALSCAQPQIERSFNWWAEAEETYYIGVGSLDPIGPQPENPSANILPGPSFDREPVAAQYTFSGRLLDGEKGVPFTMPITVEVTCVASWCGSFPKPGTSGLMALRGVGVQNLTLERHACPGSIFPAKTETKVNQCIRDGKCAEPTRP